MWIGFLEKCLVLKNIYVFISPVCFLVLEFVWNVEIWEDCCLVLLESFQSQDEMEVGMAKIAVKIYWGPVTIIGTYIVHNWYIFSTQPSITDKGTTPKNKAQSLQMRFELYRCLVVAYKAETTQQFIVAITAIFTFYIPSLIILWTNSQNVGSDPVLPSTLMGAPAFLR